MASERAPRKVELIFFRNDAGGEPVRNWLREMGEADRMPLEVTCCVHNGVGRSACRCAARWGKVCGRSEPIFLVIARHGC